ncbi:hypothetical protein Barb4_00019 [Bacteroidales bacterium Barb4]|nr:hypothetical protein Barb4_00019 [Bacteroidales bacterium Barb4]
MADFEADRLIKKGLYLEDYEKTKSIDLQKIQTAIESIDKLANENMDEQPKTSKGGTMKVTTQVMEILLKKSGVDSSNADKTKIATFISYITGNSENTIRTHLSKHDEFTSAQKDEIEKVNKMLKDLNIEETLKYNKIGERKNVKH